ncbi:MAG: class I SAM-dependent methyltransferase [Nitrososphaerota archaeon]|nr:class I SAM-dependent methyltransferase [Nitrososphaerota archaeon]MDG6903485.1 class I SAM-dependent methyltransferase [Nitrososphaerota archaeon]MDG6912040.1 class I SAM-dependent methyltransferase [Nitrososphaerota archaeon]MDG6924772.1 class I SAM-dependent methyltransferase [Nitrososphaerota archaeon]MDG6940865.1 class I SAM-dependent methyltransferase [Nitrososphaerota archaeon]
MDTFERLVAEAWTRQFQGWDFEFLNGRYVEGRTSWNYERLLGLRLAGAGTYLDLGTGGGELLSSMASLPRRTVATEGYRPNLQVALRRLNRRGVDVVFSFSDDNAATGMQRGVLPFRDATIDLVSSRHEAFVAKETARVLRPGGAFVTQQVGPGNDEELALLLGEREDERGRWDLAEAVRQVRGAGLRVTESGEEKVRSSFLDIGALAYYLKAVGPLEFDAASLAKLERPLREADSKIRTVGSFDVTASRFYLVAEKQGEDPSQH